ncbi:Nitroreductase [Zopfia rhizophila CBS 207.26]|uniref:Nitroreductase n=1 Tax=Zopfia rhizophila CBS 207.26 TaxID=1314779 RepID=A0A6A6DXM9_9PEZI|nr:Nitroreductase [Zopfia rhizophila CBS 207.26]
MVVATRSLLTGLFAGVLLGFLLHLVLPLYQPALEDTHLRVSTAPETFSPTLADMLRNSLQIARGAVRGAAYKSSRVASSALLQTSSPLSSATSNLNTEAFSTSTTKMASQKPFLQAIKDRRTFYQLNNTAPISDKRIVEIVKEAIHHVPSSFNSQSARLVVLLKKDHELFWDYVLDVLKPIVPEEQLPSTQKRIAGFRAGYGTILFLEDPDDVAALQKAFPLYAHHFPDWSEHTSAMHQYCLWVALEAEGFGANLQHYNPLIDRKAAEHWKFPVEWKLRAQLVFGGKVTDDAGPKDFKEVEGKRLFVHGADS